MKHTYTFANCIDIILCELTYDYIQKIGFDFYWLIKDKKSGIQHIYPVYSEDKLFPILAKNKSLIVRTSDSNILEDIRNDKATYILHLPEQINEFFKERSP